jgi:multicomponent Na+:H+ antiporter subunit D
MNNLVVMPLIIPIITGLVLVIFRRQIRLHRLMSLLATLSVSVVAILLMNQVVIDGPQTLQLGNWEAPFGISLVADMLSGILVLVTGIVVSCCLLYAFFSIGRDRELNYFYPLVLFLLTGINGSFLTGDIFNLFVCFEVMLVASYVLISLGGTKLQLRESFKYILVNLISSFLFLVSIAYLYGMLGTLNMAHLSVRVAEAGQVGLLIPVAILFLIVFSIKAGLLLFYWLPGSYSAPPTVVGAVFASLLTKVGAYAIIRVFSLIFHHDPQITYLLIGILAGLTMLLGAIGAVAYWDIKRILTYNVIISIGLILAGFASFNYAGLTGSVYYLIHDMVVKALIFLAGGTIIYVTGTSKIREISGLIQLHPQLGWMFFIGALSLAGIPPLSGFIGKVLITMGTFQTDYFWLGGIGLLTSLMVLYSLMKIFMECFWGNTELTPEMEKGSTRGLLFPIGILVALTILLGVGAEGIHQYVDLAAEGLLDSRIYIEAVMSGNPTP